MSVEGKHYGHKDVGTTRRQIVKRTRRAVERRTRQDAKKEIYSALSDLVTPTDIACGHARTTEA